MKCKNCKQVFKPRKFNWKYCESDVCNNIGVQELIKKVRATKAKDNRKKTKKEKEALLTHRDYLKLFQTVFNTYIRTRDKELPCVSCGKNNEKQFHAGHYRSVGSCPELRFEELNVWRQCATCNTYLHGNLIEYRKELIKRIGVDKVEWLEGPQPSNKLMIPEIKTKIVEYKLKLKSLL
jgi:rubredoxin